VSYTVSQNHEFLAVLTEGALQTFKVADLIFKEQNKSPPIDQGLDGYLGQGYVEAVNSEEMGDDQVEMDDMQSVDINL
jgi:hypothetical protein